MFSNFPQFFLKFPALPAESSWIKNGGVAGDIYQNLLRILRYESKDTTYKFALLRGLIEISSESPHIKQGADFVTAPFGLLVEKWVQYYWPIIEQDIPQKHGGEKTKPLAFRRIFKALTDVYSAGAASLNSSTIITTEGCARRTRRRTWRCCKSFDKLSPSCP